MFKFDTYIIVAFVALSLNASQAKSLNADQDRTGKWLNELFPLLDYVGTQYGMCTSNTSDALKETLSKLAVLKRKLTGVQDQHKGNQKSIQGHSTDQIIARKEEKTLLENIEKRLGKIEDHIAEKNQTKFQQWSILEVGKPQDFRAVLDMLEKFQTDMQKNIGNLQQINDQQSVKIIKKALMGMANFKRIGTRYFYIETEVMQNWYTAIETCREMGGLLASIKDYSELEELDNNLIKPEHYWLGINDLNTEGEYVSEATGKNATYLPWRSGQPDNYNKNEDCVHISSLEDLRKSMNDLPCSEKHYFICQFGNEI
ncbi:accessory gland protein Acp29AB-like [Drosophila subpulchrella]|uniref:accessory gland protein Acp29AB-like n=1 Tax=Drosophila subpulchrella TaxID=1486046 RepID=UPI0018A18CC8|nr:accessory gland protein Acp29AB-like [Drosophila subpulchrella]